MNFVNDSPTAVGIGLHNEGKENSDYYLVIICYHLFSLLSPNISFTGRRS